MSARNRRRRGKTGAERDSFEDVNADDVNVDADADVSADDVNAEELFGERRSRRRSSAHKDEQLCEQVFQILTYAMADLGDEVLRGLAIESVTMGLDGSRLVVTVISTETQLASIVGVHDRLARSQGRLRSEIAAGIHRKRTPELVFRVVTREEVER